MKKLFFLLVICICAQSCNVHKIPYNEIWYTNGSTTQSTTPYKTDVFGANIISNVYNVERECWVIEFDGNVTTIGERAFYDCDSLTSITIPDSVTTIGSRAFASCRCLAKFKGKFASNGGRCLIIDGTLNSFAPAGLTEYTIPDGVTAIGDCAFYECTSLTSITIPDSVTTIGDAAFLDCSSLTSITIPDSVTTIGYGAFYSCDSLTNITIPDSVTTIGDSAFYECTSLISITIPDSVTTIGEWAFQYCSSLTSVTIGDSVTTIGNYAFSNCDSLTSITISDSVTTIGLEAFYECTSLTSITIPDSVTTIGDYAFFGCTSLESVCLNSKDAPILGEKVFANCHIGCVFNIPDNTCISYWLQSAWTEYGYLLRYGGIKRPTENYAVGDLVTTDGVVGIVYYASDDIVRIISVDETIAQWSTYPCNTDYNGLRKMRRIKHYDNWEERFPAFKWCADLGDNWYLPTYNELCTIYEIKDTLNATLSANGYEILGGCYWSSTEYNDNYAYGLNFSNGYGYDDGKDYSYYVRGVLAF